MNELKVLSDNKDKVEEEAKKKVDALEKEIAMLRETQSAKQTDQQKIIQNQLGQEKERYWMSK